MTSRLIEDCFDQECKEEKIKPFWPGIFLCDFSVLDSRVVADLLNSSPGKISRIDKISINYKYGDIKWPTIT